MKCRFEPISQEHRKPVIDIFNHYIENSFAAYPENKVPYAFFDILMRMAHGYPTLVAKDEEAKVVGFGLLRPHNPMSTFAQTAEITYFIKPEYTARGIGSTMLKFLIDGARKQGISSILANICSLNKRSIHFHEKKGFVECGRFRRVGKKKGQLFDVVWMQKIL